MQSNGNNPNAVVLIVSLCIGVATFGAAVLATYWTKRSLGYQKRAALRESATDLELGLHPGYAKRTLIARGSELPLTLRGPRNQTVVMFEHEPPTSSPTSRTGAAHTQPQLANFPLGKPHVSFMRST